MDDLLAKHISYLFIRDPLVLFSSDLQQDPSKDTGLFEVSIQVTCEFINFYKVWHCLQNISTSNWQSLRFKPPKEEINAGWRVEVRTMDVSVYSYNAQTIIACPPLLMIAAEA